MDGNGPEDWVVVVNRLEQGLVGARALSCSVAARRSGRCKAGGGGSLRPVFPDSLFSTCVFPGEGSRGGALRRLGSIAVDCLLSVSVCAWLSVDMRWGLSVPVAHLLSPGFVFVLVRLGMGCVSLHGCSGPIDRACRSVFGRFPVTKHRTVYRGPYRLRNMTKTDTSTIKAIPTEGVSLATRSVMRVEIPAKAEMNATPSPVERVLGFFSEGTSVLLHSCDVPRLSKAHGNLLSK